MIFPAARFRPAFLFALLFLAALLTPPELWAAPPTETAPPNAQDTRSTNGPNEVENGTQASAINTKTSPSNILRKTDLVSIDASWPSVGIPRVDEESEAFVKTLVDSFEAQTREVADELAAESPAEGSEENDLPAMFPYELTVTHEVTHPSDTVISIVWNIWSFTGGAHGQLDIVSNNYNVANGFPLLLEDLFLDPQLAILQFTKVSRQKLSEPDDGTEGEGLPDDMLRAGTEPVEENFRTFALLPAGIRLYFQPYQVAPWAAGPQTVDVKLDDLNTAKPKFEYWGKQPS